MLRALHWAKRKDEELNSDLQERAERKRREQERRTINSRLKKEAADRAYKQWALKLSQPTQEPPHACKKRRAVKSLSQTPYTCSTCKTGSKRSSARHSSSAKATSTIKVNLHQTKRNIECVGKPAKMHPYTNYPPRNLLNSSTNRSLNRSGRSSRAAKPSIASSPILMSITVDGRRHSQKHIATTECVQQEDDTSVASPSESLDINKGSDRGGDKLPQCELNLGFLKRSLSCPDKEQDADEFEEDGQVQFLIGGVEEEEEEEEGEREEGEKGEGGGEEEEEQEGEYDEYDDIAFHDVGRTNSLNSLQLPMTLTKDRSPAEVIKLLQYLGSSPSDSNQSRLHCRSPRYRQHSLFFQRRFSLGAIPEGQMLTNYTNESITSLDGLSSRLKYMGLSPRGSTAWEEEDEGEEAEEDGGDGIMEQVQDEVQLSSSGSDSAVEDDREDVGEPEEGHTELSAATGSVGSRRSRLQTLNIINFAWDTSSNSVHTSVTKSPMIPANHSWPSSAFPRSRPSSPHTSSLSPPPQQPQSRPRSLDFSRPPTPKLKPISSFESIQVHRKQTNTLSPSQRSPLPPRELKGLHENDESSDVSSPLPQPSPGAASTPHPIPQNSLFTANSLLGSPMSRLASKSMLSLSTPDPIVPIIDRGNATNQEECTNQEPKLKRRIKSAPNMLHLHRTTSESQLLKTSVFTFGGILQ